MLPNPLIDALRITDEMREGAFENFRLMAEVDKFDDFWNDIEDEPLTPDAVNPFQQEVVDK